MVRLSMLIYFLNLVLLPLYYSLNVLLPITARKHLIRRLYKLCMHLLCLCGFSVLVLGERNSLMQLRGQYSDTVLQCDSDVIKCQLHNNGIVILLLCL